MKRLLFNCLIPIVLTACGGGSESASPATENQSNTSVAVDSSASSENTNQTASNKLVENKAADNAQFTQFKSQNMSIDISGLGFESQSVYLKIYTLDNKTLFLGKVPNSPSFEFYLPNDVSKVKYDVFSTLKSDPQITKEYEL